MPTSSPGRGVQVWEASLSSADLPLDTYIKNGLNTIPVALVPKEGSLIRMNKVKLLQENLRAASERYQEITDVRPYGKNGIVCRSADLLCVADLLKCTTFGSAQVTAFIPAHLACVKGLVRDVDASLSAAEVLEEFSSAGVVSVYRCNRPQGDSRIATESVIITVPGTRCPSELKVWPILYRVQQLSPRPLQCRCCWRYGHSTKVCKSVSRCRMCGDTHPTASCSSEEEHCCLCGGPHPADYSNCPARAKEQAIVELTERRRCSRAEAIAELNERSTGYAGAVGRTPHFADVTSVQSVAASIEKRLCQVVERVLTSFMANFSQLLSSNRCSSCSSAQIHSVSRASPPPPPMSTGVSNPPPVPVAQPAVPQASDKVSKKTTKPVRSDHVLEVPSNGEEDSCPMEGVGGPNKRGMSPPKVSQWPRSKQKKGLPKDSQDLLAEAVIEAELDSS